MPLQVEVDRARCIATRSCANAAPGTFALDGSGLATVLDPTANGEQAVIDAARSCPTGAISVIKDGSRVD